MLKTKFIAYFKPYLSENGSEKEELIKRSIERRVKRRQAAAISSSGR